MAYYLEPSKFLTVDGEFYSNNSARSKISLMM